MILFAIISNPLKGRDYMKHFLILLFTAVLLCGITACGGEESVAAASRTEVQSVISEALPEPAEEAPEPEVQPVPSEALPEPAEEAPEPLPEEPPVEAAEEISEALPPAEIDPEPVSGDLGEYHVTILAAEDFVNIEGEPAIRFYYDFTNNSDSAAIAWAVLSAEARQDDYELVTAYAEYLMDVPEYSNDSLRIQPGMTIRCVREYDFKPLGGMLEFTISDLMGTQEITMRFDPNALQGRPTPLEMPSVEEPQWLQGISADCEKENYSVRFHGYELTTDGAGEPAVRVLWEYTNQSDIPTAFFYDLNIVAFQDGVELQYAWMEESTQEELNAMEEIQPGESLVVSSVYELRSESPVEFHVEALWESTVCGVVVPVRNSPDE